MKKNGHLIDKQILAYIAETDDKDARARVDDHLSSCTVCQNKIEYFKFGIVLSELRDLERERPHNGPCLSASTLKHYATKSKEISPDKRAEIGVHLIHCAKCETKYLNFVAESFEAESAFKKAARLRHARKRQRSSNASQSSSPGATRAIKIQIPSSIWQPLRNVHFYSTRHKKLSLNYCELKQWGYESKAEILLFPINKDCCDLAIKIMRNAVEPDVLVIQTKTNQFSAPFERTENSKEYFAKLQLPWSTLTGSLRITLASESLLRQQSLSKSSFAHD